MKGAIFYSSKYGSTAQYAEWISEAAGVPIYNMKSTEADPANFDFLVIGCPVIYHKLFFKEWLQRNQNHILTKPTILFTVSGASAGAKLDGWIDNSLPEALISHVTHIALLGRQNPRELTLFDRVMLIIGGLKNPDPVASQEELKGFDFMDKSSIQPIINLINKLRSQDKLVPTT